MKEKKFIVNYFGYLKNFNKEINFVKNKKFVNKKSINTRNLFIKNDIYYPERKIMFFKKFPFKKHFKAFMKDHKSFNFYNRNLVKLRTVDSFKHHYTYNKNLFSFDEKNVNYDFTKNFIEHLKDCHYNFNRNLSIKFLINERNNVINNSFFDYYKKIFEKNIIKKQKSISKSHIYSVIKRGNLKYVRNVSVSKKYKSLFKKIMFKAYNDWNLNGIYGYRGVRLLYNNNKRFLFKIKKEIKKIHPKFFINYFKKKFYYLLKNRNKEYSKFKFKKNLVFLFDYIFVNFKLQKQKLLYYKLKKQYNVEYKLYVKRYREMKNILFHCYRWVASYFVNYKDLYVYLLSMFEVDKARFRANYNKNYWFLKYYDIFKAREIVKIFNFSEGDIWDLLRQHIIENNISYSGNKIFKRLFYSKKKKINFRGKMFLKKIKNFKFLVKKSVYKNFNLASYKNLFKNYNFFSNNILKISLLMYKRKTLGSGKNPYFFKYVNLFHYSKEYPYKKNKVIYKLAYKYFPKLVLNSILKFKYSDLIWVRFNKYSVSSLVRRRLRKKINSYLPYYVKNKYFLSKIRKNILRGNINYNYKKYIEKIIKGEKFSFLSLLNKYKFLYFINTLLNRFGFNDCFKIYNSSILFKKINKIFLKKFLFFVKFKLDKNYNVIKLLTSNNYYFAFKRFVGRNYKKFWRFKKSSLRNLKLNQDFSNFYLKEKFNFDASLYIRKFFLSFVKNGKRGVIKKIIVKLVYIIKFFNNVNIISFFKLLFFRLQPLIFSKKFHIGKKQNNVPFFYGKKLKNRDIKRRFSSLLISWLIKSIKIRKEKNIFLRIVCEMLDVLKNKGNSIELKKNFYLNFYNSKSYIRLLKFVTWI